MLRTILLFILVVFVARAFWRVLDGVLDGMRSGPGVDAAPRPPARSVQMARDPVCGTYVVPDRAVTITVAGRTVHFCSTGCRDAYLARPAQVQGRSA